MKAKASRILLILTVPLIILWSWSAPAAEETTRLRVNGVELAYEARGQGPPLLMIMGYAGTMEAWAPELLDELSRNFSLILYDHRGMGRSGKWNRPVGLKMLADDACALLDALGHGRANVLGWSMGSMIAQEMALAQPDKVAKLILYGVVYNNGPVVKALKAMGKATPKEFKAMMFPAGWLKKNPDIFQRLPRPSTRPGPAAVAAQARAMTLWPGTENRLKRIIMPTLIIAGGADNVTPPEQAVRMAGLIPGAWLARFKEGGHWLMYQNPLDLARLVKTFLLIKEDLRSSGAYQKPESAWAKAA